MKVSAAAIAWHRVSCVVCDKASASSTEQFLNSTGTELQKVDSQQMHVSQY